MRMRELRWAALGLCTAMATASLGCSDDGNTAATSSSSSTGGFVDNGHTATETVNAGNVAASPNYRMVFTFGQPTQNQGKSTSDSYGLRGGLIGATGSEP